MYFRRVVISAFIVGICAGLILSAVQTLQITPIILQAETYETQHSTHSDVGHRHGLQQTEEDNGHQHNNDAWAPEDGVERQTYTIISNIMAASGFAMLLISLMSFAQKETTIGSGLWWGLAGFTVFFLSPSLGVGPEIPGAANADLAQRQIWWSMTVVATATGLACLVFAKRPYKLVGLLLVALPHIVGAPLSTGDVFNQPDSNTVALLENLQQQFLQATAIANGAYWIVLGVLSALSVKKFVRPSPTA